MNIRFILINSDFRKYGSVEVSHSLWVGSIIATNPDVTTSVTNCLIGLVKLIPIIQIRIHLRIISMDLLKILLLLTDRYA